MPRGHKYIKKYRNSHGNWTYIYPDDLPQGTPAGQPHVPTEAHKPNVNGPGHLSYDTAYGVGRVHLDSGRRTFISRNRDVTGRYAIVSNRKDDGIALKDISGKGVHKRGKAQRLSEKRESINRKAVGVFVNIAENSTLRPRKLTRTEKAQRRIMSIFKRTKRASSRAIEKGKKKLRNLLPHTEVTFHDAELKHR